MSDTIKGFLINGEILHYDYNALDNVPDNGAGTFWATYGTTTGNEIEGAIASNKTVALNYENHIYYLSSILDKIAPSNVYLFRSEDNVANYQIMMSGSNWQPVRVLDWIQPSNEDPLPLLEDGVSSPGTSEKYSRGDHRHPMPEMNLGIDQTDGLLYFYINNIKHGNGISISGGSSGSGLTNEIKQALLQLASKVAYIDANGQNYYQALYDALYSTPKTLVSISATYNQTDTIYTTDSLNDIPSRGTLTVIATYDDSSTETITNYTLSGNLTAGTSIITVIYSGKTTTINVNVTAVVGTYTIINNLTGCSTSNNATTIIENNSYNATITASSGYTLTGATVSVTMGGNTVTGAYSNGTISIANVTGDIVITVTAAARTLSSISAVFNQGSNVIYTTDTLDSLKQYLAVTANYADGGSETISDYTLSGTLVEGISTITVTYNGQTTAFSVMVSEEPIPSDYQQVEYISNENGSSTVPWVGTNVELSGVGDVVINASFMHSHSTDDNPYVLTTRTTTSGNALGIALGIRTNVKDEVTGETLPPQLGIFGGATGSWVNIAPENVSNTKVSVTAIISDDGVSITDGNLSNFENFETAVHNITPIYLFGYKKYNVSQNANAFHGRIYSLKITENDAVVMDLVPCIRVSDNVAGFYNKATKAFFTGTGATALVAGPAVGE